VQFSNGLYHIYMQAYNSYTDRSALSGGNSSGGYDPVIFTAAVPAAIPTTGITVLGSLTTPPVVPSFQWNFDPNASHYRLFVDTPDYAAPALIDQWYPATGGAVTCNATTCSVSPRIQFSNGLYHVYMQASNPYTGRSAVSGVNSSGGYDPVIFTAAVPTPAVPSGISATGNLSVSPATPSFQWNNDPAAERYLLYVATQSDALVHSVWYQASAACSGSICTVTPGFTLTSGQYKILMRSYNSYGGLSAITGDNGNGTYTPISFTVGAP